MPTKEIIFSPKIHSGLRHLELVSSRSTVLLTRYKNIPRFNKKKYLIDFVYDVQGLDEALLINLLSSEYIPFPTLLNMSHM